MVPVLAYWKTRCLCQPIRLLLKYAGVEFEDKYYKEGPAPDYDKTGWKNDKYNLGLDFPNLPYYIDDNVKLTESKAILRYLGRKHGLCGSTLEEQAKIDMLEAHVTDFQWKFIIFTYYDYDKEDKKKTFFDALPGYLKSYADFLGDRPWFNGDKITYVDFLVYEVLDQHLMLDSTCLDNFQNLQQFQKRVEDLPPIKEYMASPEFLKSPLNNKYAKFGNK